MFGVARPSRQGGRVAQRQEAPSYAYNCFGTGPIAQFVDERFFQPVWQPKLCTTFA